MQFFFKSFSAYFILIAFSLLFQFCCTYEYQIVEGEGRASVYQRSESGTYLRDTLTGNFNLEADFNLMVIGQNNNIGLISNGFATTCEIDVKNSLRLDKIKVFCSKDFLLNNETIISGTNFIRTPGLYKSVYDEEAFVQLRFSDAFLAQTEFIPDHYTFRIEVETSDGLVLSTEESNLVYLDF